MNLSKIFIERPVATSILVAAIVIFGVIAFRTLPVNELPNVDFPTIQVTAELRGANPEVMASSVATPLERQFSTIAGVETMNSGNSPGFSRTWPAKSKPGSRSSSSESRCCKSRLIG